MCWPRVIELSAHLSDPRATAPLGGSGAGDRPKPVISDITELTLLDQYDLTPERVKAYSIEGNSIHYEQEAAERAGFRARRADWRWYGGSLTI